MELDVGVHENIEHDEYLALPYASQSNLKKLMTRSPRRVRYEVMNPPDPTPALVMGRAIDMAVLDVESFDVTYTMAETCSSMVKSTKKPCEHPGKFRYGGEWFCGTHKPKGVFCDDLQVLSAEDYLACTRIRSEIAAHPEASAILEICTRRRQVLIWSDEETGVKCKAELDLAADDWSFLADLKSTERAHPDIFSADIYKRGYYIQAAFYLKGAITLGLGSQQFGIIAAEKPEPSDVACFEIEGEAIDAGMVELRPLLQKWAACEFEGRWPSYEGVTKITLPPYSWKQIEGRTAYEDA